MFEFGQYILPVIKALNKQVEFESKYTIINYTLSNQNYQRVVETYRINDLKDIEAETGVNYKDLLAICLVEGFYNHDSLSFGCHDEATGRQGEVGAFQIHPYWHDTSEARNFKKSAIWTAKRLNLKGYSTINKKARHRAIMSHNGAGELAVKYADKVILISSQL